MVAIQIDVTRFRLIKEAASKKNHLSIPLEAFADSEDKSENEKERQNDEWGEEFVGAKKIPGCVFHGAQRLARSATSFKSNAVIPLRHEQRHPLPRIFIA